MLSYLWIELRLLWDSYHFEFLIEEMCACKFREGVRVVLRSQTAHEVYMGMRTQDKIALLQNLVLARQSKRSLEVMETLKEEFSQHPYATVALFVLVNDPKGQYTLHANHLERCLENIDPAEYARYKFAKAVAPFHEQVVKAVNDYSNQEDNSQQRRFGQSLRDKLEKQIDAEVVKLGHGFVNGQEYDEQLIKLFELAEQGDLQGFKKKVTDNDVRIFKRKRLETVKLTPSFAVNRYCSFTPLLWAIQYRHLTITSFIMEKMKIGLRQALCLQTVDTEEAFMDLDVNEEYQAYSLLVASANKDETMLRYLWDTHGSYLWTERHFEPLMRYLIESEWLDGIRIIFRSEMTQHMIRAFTADERTFFIENMIGEVFNLKQ